MLGCPEILHEINHCVFITSVFFSSFWGHFGQHTNIYSPHIFLQISIFLYIISSISLGIYFVSNINMSIYPMKFFLIREKVFSGSGVVRSGEVVSILLITSTSIFEASLYTNQHPKSWEKNDLANPKHHFLFTYLCISISINGFYLYLLVFIWKIFSKCRQNRMTEHRLK